MGISLNTICLPWSALLIFVIVGVVNSSTIAQDLGSRPYKSKFDTQWHPSPQVESLDGSRIINPAVYSPFNRWPQFNQVPKYNQLPRYNSVPAYNRVPKYNSVPTYTFYWRNSR